MKIFKRSVCFLICIGVLGCKKVIETAQPTTFITSSQVFASDDQATSAMSGIYYRMINQSSSIFSGAMTVYMGMSSDELIPFAKSDVDLMQFFQNNLLATNNVNSSRFWNISYQILYGANSIIEGLNNYSGVSDSVKNELLGEAYFLRAFVNFYLVNLYSDIPLINSTNWQKTNLLSRSSTSDVNITILEDLTEAQNRLPSEYSVGKGERIVPNRWAATALLSRVYLYLNKWSEAENQSGAIINNSNLFDTVSLSNVFLRNSKEAIWQLKQNNINGPNYNAVPESYQLIPRTSTTQPYAYLTSQLLNSFEMGDKRRNNWVDSTKYPVSNGTVYYYPAKYKVGPAQAISNGAYKEYYSVFRLSEQYLIRAEARVKQGNITGAISDINVIRKRAGLPGLLSSLTQAQVETAIQQENKIEFFAEWGHRWLDLKRLERIDAVLAPIKGTNWQATDIYSPIPQVELIVNPNLIQNPGY